jgi:uncharacterized YkwD family protein
MKRTRNLTTLVAALIMAGMLSVAGTAAAATTVPTCYTQNTFGQYFSLRTLLERFAPQWFQITPNRTVTPAPQPSAASAPAAKPPAASAPAAAAGLTAQEQQMLNLVNAERARAGLPALKADPELTKLARLKSQDMIQLNYFSHQSPTYGSPFDMMRRFGITYRTAGENIAGNQSVEAAHRALMNSPGHRANILNRDFTHIGIGIQTGGRYGMMFTQMFVGR